MPGDWSIWRLAQWCIPKILCNILPIELWRKSSETFWIIILKPLLITIQFAGLQNDWYIACFLCKFTLLITLIGDVKYTLALLFNTQKWLLLFKMWVWALIRISKAFYLIFAAMNHEWIFLILLLRKRSAGCFICSAIEVRENTCILRSWDVNNASECFLSFIRECAWS